MHSGELLGAADSAGAVGTLTLRPFLCGTAVADNLME